jgi:hypothetical protein
MKKATIARPAFQIPYLRQGVGDGILSRRFGREETDANKPRYRPHQGHIDQTARVVEV